MCLPLVYPEGLKLFPAFLTALSTYTHSLDVVHEHPGELVQIHASFKRRILLIRVNSHCSGT